MLLRTARRKGGANFVAHLSSRISREGHSSYASSAFACSWDAPALREVTKDMEQNSED